MYRYNWILLNIIEYNRKLNIQIFVQYNVAHKHAGKEEKYNKKENTKKKKIMEITGCVGHVKSPILQKHD